MKKLGMAVLLSAALAAGVFTGCAAGTGSASAASSTASAATASATSAAGSGSAAAATAQAGTASAGAYEGALFSASDLFTDRDLTQTADLSDATEIALSSGQDVTIAEEGVYVVSGTAENVTITVDADSSAKVQLVLDGASITNSGAPAIYVASADKVFVTTAQGTTNALTVTGAFSFAADDAADGAIFAKDDIVLNGSGTLVVKSSANGIVGKDDVKVTGGTYQITASGHGIQGKDSVAIADGDFSISAGTDGIHAENADDASLGYVYIGGGSFQITAASDGVEGASAVQVDDGSLSVSAAEGIEATYVQVNGGTIDIAATDDGINATNKSSAYGVVLEIAGGDVSIDMAQGDTDALDSNGDLYITGGNVNITAQFAFDFDGQGVLSGGTVYVNGEQVTEITNSMMGGGMRGGMGGQQGGMEGAGGQPGGMGGRR